MDTPQDTDWHRARRPEQKQARHEAILAAARKTLDSVGIEKTTLTSIAKEAGLSKANCYRYFENREAILLQLVLEEISDWSNAVSENLSVLKKHDDLEAIAQTMVTVTLSRPRLCELGSSLSTVLEQNVSEDLLAEFKRNFHNTSTGWLDALTKILPELSTDQAGRFSHYFLLFTAAAWSSANSSPAMKKVMARPEFKPLRFDLETMAYNHTLILLKGLLA